MLAHVNRTEHWFFEGFYGDSCMVTIYIYIYIYIVTIYDNIYKYIIIILNARAYQA